MPKTKKRVKNQLIWPFSIALGIIILAIIIVILTNDSNETETDKRYILKDLEECSRVKYLCKEGYQPFQDEIGCGCEEIPMNEEKFYCSQSSRGADVCIKVYDPVCGWYDQEIKCLKYPCAQNYGNSCEACTNEEVEYYTKGECPK